MTGMGIYCSPVRGEEDDDPCISLSTKQVVDYEAAEDISNTQTEGMFIQVSRDSNFCAMIYSVLATVG